MSLKSISSFKEAFRLIVKDKVSLTLALIPIFIGIVLFVLLGVSMFSSVHTLGSEYINDYLGTGTLGEVAKWIVSLILSVLLYFIVNFTFVLIVSIIASPFNDILSNRIEKQMLGEELPSFSESMKGSMSNLVKTIVTESKKVTIILGITMMAAVIGFIPFLSPLSILLSAIVLSTEFIDFSWSRHNMEFKECRTEYRKNILSYSFGGLFFMLLVSIPLVNIIVPSYGTSYFTVLWVKNNDSRSQITK